MKPSKTVEFIVSLCWNGEEIRATSLVLNESYILDGTKCVFNESVLDELISYQEHSLKPYSVVRLGNNRVVNVTGKRIKH